ncbi:hypothetical protein TYRP_023463 [Tyrophagus putrescentiae]|nr:hypothetical protein TYRP_023463 [Tyrophagus putrescentiae]
MESTEEEAEEATMDAASNHDRLRKIARALELNEHCWCSGWRTDGLGCWRSWRSWTSIWTRPSQAFVDLLSMRSRGGGGGHHNQWSEAERETIVKEVRSQYRMVHNRELVEQMTRLLESSGQGQQGPTAEVTKRIEQLNDQLALARGGDPEPERGEEAMRAIDWMVVAKQLPPKRTADDAELQYRNYLHHSIPKGEWSVEEARLKELVEAIRRVRRLGHPLCADRPPARR